MGIESSRVGRGASPIEAPSHDMLPKAGFAAMLGFKGCNISLMRLKRAEIANRRRQAFAFGKVAGRMAVAFAFGMVERVIDERAAQNGSGQGCFVSSASAAGVKYS